MNMQRKIEGLILSKVPYRERDLICRLLLRNGKKIGVLFFGGQGGGRSKAPSHLEVGILMKIDLNYKRNVGGEGLFIAKEWLPAWMHQNIRYDYQAFTLACLFFEAIDKIAIQDDLQEENEKEFEGVFRVASNAIYYLEASLKNKKFQLPAHFMLFFTKLLWELGVGPNLSHCIFCEHPFRVVEPLIFLDLQGGFSCAQCAHSHSEEVSSTGIPLKGKEYERIKWGKKIFQSFALIYGLKYSHYAEVPKVHSEILRLVFFYFCYQFQLDEKKFRTMKFLLP